MEKKCNMKKNSALQIVKNSLIYFFLSVIALILLSPMLLMLLRSFMTSDQIYLEELLFPTFLNKESYKEALNPVFLKFIGNTFFVLIFNIIGVPLSAGMCAFAFSILKWKGQSLVFACVMATLLLPSVVTQIPLFAQYYAIGWINTYLPLIVPGFLGGGAVNIFLTRQFMKGIPREVIEASEVDGASKLRIFFMIVMPLCKTIIVYIAVMTFFGVWNDFMGPLLYLQNENKYTLAVGVYYTMIEGATSFNYTANVKMAVGVVLFIPPLILFSFFQKLIMQGVATSGLKV